jgi:hypothetical protein
MTIVHSTSRARDALLLFAFSLALGLLFYRHNRKFETGDTSSYLEPGINMIEGRGFVAREPISYLWLGYYPSQQPSPDTLRTPLYPAVLGLFHRLDPSFRSLILLQHVANALVTVFLYLFLCSATGRRKLAVLAASLRALHLPSIELANQLMTETFFVLMLVVVVWLWYSTALRKATAGRLFFIGLLLGIATVLRPAAMYLYIPMAVLLAISPHIRQKKSWLLVPAVAFLCGSILPPLAWCLRNRQVSGVFTLTALLDDGLLYFPTAGAIVVDNAPVIWALTAMDGQNDFYLKVHRLYPRLIVAGNAHLRARTGGMPRDFNYAQRAALYKEAGRDLMRRNRRGVVLIGAASFVHLYFGELWESAATLGMDYRAAKIRFVPLAILQFFAGVAGALSLWRQGKLLTIIILVLTSYFSLLSIGQQAGGRFFVPIAPWYATLVAEGILVAVTTVAANYRLRQSRSAG